MGLDWIGLDRIGLSWDCHGIGLDCHGIGLAWIVLDWNRTGL